jgi:outer membrane immunogenic protein
MRQSVRVLDTWFAEGEGIVMRRQIFLTTVAFTAAAPAFAADLAVKAPMVPGFSWTGCHIGGHIGGVVSEDRTTGVLGNSRSFSSTGFVGGGQIGCDYQFAPRWIVGVEGQAAWTSLKNTHAGVVRNLAMGTTLPSQFTLRNDFLASATARLGYSVADHWLVYAKGGAAWTNEKIDVAFTNLQGVAVDPSATKTRTGWTVGTGVEWAFAAHWSSTVEYNYYDFGNHGATLFDAAHNQGVTIVRLHDRIHAVTVGVNYHF